jgi:hypothetical protein
VVDVLGPEPDVALDERQGDVQLTEAGVVLHGWLL